MRKCCRIFIITAFLALNCAAQTSSGKNAVDSLKAATKPLTPKSPITTGKSWATPPATDTRRTNEELTHLERQTFSNTNPALTPSKKNHNPGNTRTTPMKGSTATTSSGSGINAPYQKPHIPQR